MKYSTGKLLKTWFLLGFATALAACSGSSTQTAVTSAAGSTPYTIGGSVSGLTGSGLVLQNNSGDNLPVGADGSFTFATTLVAGNSFNVSVLTQPSAPVQTCVPSNAIGVVGNSNVTNVTIVCTVKVTTTDSIGGTVTGLEGTGLVLQNNGADNLQIGDNGSFTFATPVPSGVRYSVTVLSPPTGPNENCVVGRGQGTAGAADVNNVAVTCALTSATTYPVGGTVTGLPAGTTLTLQDNGRDDLPVSSDGPFTFATPIPTGSAYSVTFTAQSASSLSCSITNPSGLVKGAAVTDISITCLPQSTLAVNVVGLVGTGLMLQTDAGDTLTVTANGMAVFPTNLGAGATYAVSVLNLPTNPVQACTIANASGTIGASPPPTVTCAAPGVTTVTIGGTVTGLAGTGLVLQDNSGDNLPITASGVFTFATPLAAGSTYAVSVLTSPTGPAQTCSVTSGTGTATANITNVAINCVTPVASNFTIGGTVTGLVGAGQTGLVLRTVGDGIGVNDTITANGPFTTHLAGQTGSTYTLTVLTQPSNPVQVCVATNATGTIGNASVTNIVVTCTTPGVPTYEIGGNLSGLTGTGLRLSDVDGGDSITLNENGTFVFQTAYSSGSYYDVTVATQPTGPTQNCTVANGAGQIGNANVTNVAVTCATIVAPTHTISATVTGLTGTGLVLQDNGGDNLPVTGSSTVTFATPIASGANYAVTVLTQPGNPTQICSVTNGNGTVANANVTNVQVTCVTPHYTIGGVVSGLTGAGLVLQDNGADNLAVNSAGGENVDFTFATPINNGSTYAVTIATQPAHQTCSVTNNGNGNVTSANIANVTITCNPATYTVGGTVTGLTGSGLALLDNGADNLPITANGAFTFATALANSAAYAVSVATQPGNPLQTCSVTTGTGTVNGQNVTTVAVNCVNAYTVAGNVTGLQANGLVLQDSYGPTPAVNAATDNLSVPLTAQGAASGMEGFVFATPLTSGTYYEVTVAAQPTGQTCTVTNNLNVVASANVTNVAVACQTQTYTVGGTASRLIGSGLVLATSDQTLAVPSGATTFTFGTAEPANTVYTVTIQTQPAGQVCQLHGTNGTVTNSNVTSVVVDCTEWIWQDGANTVNAQGYYGTKGEAGETNGNSPPARQNSATWTDHNGNLWLFGGTRDGDSTYYNDMWRYDPANGWIWEAGFNTTNQQTIVDSPTLPDTPGARAYSVSWTDAAGKLWLFGGRGVDDADNQGVLNDLWMFDPTTLAWSYIRGSLEVNSAGTYPAATGAANQAYDPSGRLGAVSWTDASGDLWLFGGDGIEPIAPHEMGPLNDLWRYHPATNSWAWVSGSNDIDTNTTVSAPGGRFFSSSWTATNGRLYLFGGIQQGSDDVSELWYFDPTALQWSLIYNFGTNGAGIFPPVAGVYNANAGPGAREEAVTWVDPSGTAWLFGGATKTSGNLDDLWQYTPAGQWIFMGGTGATGPGVYPTNYGQASTYSRPGGRNSAVSWTDLNGNLWLFGGAGYDSADTTGKLNDMWEYIP